MINVILAALSATLFVTIAIIVTFSVTYLRKWRDGSLHISIYGDDIVVVPKRPADYSRAFGSHCSNGAGSYLFYVSDDVSLSDEDFEDWLVDVRSGSPIIQHSSGAKREWGLQAKNALDPVPIYTMLVKLKNRVQSDLESVDYLVGLSPMGEMMATYLTAYSRRGVVLPFHMRPPEAIRKKISADQHLMLVDTAINTGRQMGYANEWIKALGPQSPQITVAVCVFNPNFDQENDAAVELIKRSNVKYIKNREEMDTDH